MKIKVFKRLIALALTLLLCCSSLPSFALTYSGGPRDYELDRSLLLEAKNASVEGDILNFAKDGKMKFDVLLPFDAGELQLKYEALTKNVNLKVVTDEYSYEAVLEKGTTEKAIAITEVSGSHTVTFKADNTLVLNGINFHKINEQYNELNVNIAPLSDYETAMITLVALKCDVGVVKSKNSLLRWNPEDIYLAPKNINGSIYVPAKKLAEAMQLYCEDYQDLSYLYMLGESSSLSLKKGKGYYEDNENGQQDISVDVRYENGTTWVPVRKIAETFGFTVGYQDGYVLIGDRLRIKKVFEKNTFMEELKGEFEPYKVPSAKPQGKTYHVAQNDIADDANSGTEKFPFKTIQKAADVAKAGDTVIVHEGTYREIVKPKNNGTAMAPITFKAADGEKVVISALEKLSGFVKYKGDILCAAAPVDLGDGRNQLFYKGEQLIEGRHPNEDTKPDVLPYPPEVPEGLFATRGNIRITEPTGIGESSAKAYSTTDLNQEEVDYWKGGIYVSLKGSGWSLATGDIIGSAYGELTIDDHPGTKAYNLGIRPSERFGTHYYYYDIYPSDYAYITNHINTLDIPGEWYMRDHIVYVIPPEGADLAKDFEVKQRQLCIDLRGKNYITFDGIDTIGGSMTADNATGVTLLNGEFKNVAHHLKQLDGRNYAMYEDESTYSFESQKKGETGFYFGGKYNAMVNCVLDRSSAIGITLKDKYHYITNCEISNCSYSGGYPGNISIFVNQDEQTNGPSKMDGGHFITYNTLYNSGRSVILTMSEEKSDGSYYGMTPNEIAYNRCFNGSLVSRDTGVTYEFGVTSGIDTAHTAMHHNYVYDVGHWDKDTGSISMLLYQDGYTAARDTYSNVVWYDDINRPIQPRMLVFMQNPAYSVLRTRNNGAVGHLAEGESMLERGDFPGTRLFCAGADHGLHAKKFLENYNAHDNGVVYEKPVDVKVNKETGAETFSFKDIELKDGATILTYYMEREYGTPVSTNVKAKVYDKSGKLVYENSNITPVPDFAHYVQRFYVDELHQGAVILTKHDAGIYDIELEFADSGSDVKFILPRFLDITYDNLYTKEDEASGIVSYRPTGSSIDEETGKETFSFEDVKLSGDCKTLFKIHGTRALNQETNVDITTYVYNKSGELVTSIAMPNAFTNTQPQKYEVLEGMSVVDEVPEGLYDVKFEFGDEYFDIVRIIPTAADPAYDNLFDYPEIFLGGSFDDWTPGKAYELDLSKWLSYTYTDIANFNHFSSRNTWDHTVYYKDRTISNAATMLRITHCSGGSYYGSKVKLYVDTIDSEPIAEWTIGDTKWAAVTEYIDLNRKLKPGTYTFIFDYDGDMLSSNLYNFSFVNEVLDMDKE